MFIPVGKLIVALVWAFWMMSVDSSLGREHNDKEEQIKKIIKVTDEESPEYNPTYGSTLERVLDNGEKYSGCTVHYVTSKLDSGKIILQEKVRVGKRDTPKILAKKILSKEHKLYPKALLKIFNL